MASAHKRRERTFPQAEFEIELATALQMLLNPNDVGPNDTWHFQVDGTVLKITRMSPVTEIEVPPSNAPSAQSLSRLK